MSVKSELWKYLDNLPQCEISSWQLYDAMHAITGRCTLPSTLISYAREYADISGSEFTCFDNQKSEYKYIPGHKISGAITAGRE
jgi:hypothetical protein